MNFNWNTKEKRKMNKLRSCQRKTVFSGTTTTQQMATLKLPVSSPSRSTISRWSFSSSPSRCLFCFFVFLLFQRFSFQNQKKKSQLSASLPNKLFVLYSVARSQQQTWHKKRTIIIMKQKRRQSLPT